MRDIAWIDDAWLQVHMQDWYLRHFGYYYYDGVKHDKPILDY